MLQVKCKNKVVKERFNKKGETRIYSQEKNIWKMNTREGD